MVQIATTIDLPLPLHTVAVTLAFCDDAAPRLFHQAALTAFLRSLLDGPPDWERLLVADAVESGRTAYQAGDGYRFSITALPGGEGLLAELIARLRALPGSARRLERWLPLRDNLAFVALEDAHAGRPLAAPERAVPYGAEALAEEVAWWRGRGGPVRWRWLSPAQLLRSPQARRGARGDARYCRDAGHLDSALLLTRARDSVERLAGAVSSPPPPPPPPVQMSDAQLFWVDFSYRDGEGGERNLGGLTGCVTLDLPADLDPRWWRCLILGQYLGIGQRRAFGWGRYRLETQDGASTAPRVRPAASLLAQAARPANLGDAWAEIRANHPGAGLARFTGWGREEDAEVADDLAQDDEPDDPDLDLLGRRLARAEWQPAPLRVQVLQKPDGEPRVLAIPPFVDRVAQRAVAQVLAPGLDAVMYAHSYGYRRGRSRLSARYAIQSAYRQGYRWVYESDVDDFFDSVDLDRLHNRLRAFYRDDPAVGRIMAWMHAPLDYGGRLIRRERGLPQGAPLSPLLANLMLDDFDHDMEAAGFRLVRFADDFVVLCKDAAQAEAADREARRSLAELGLAVNPRKTRIVPFEQGFRYLGYLFVNDLAVDQGGRRRQGGGTAKPPPAWLARIARRPARPVDAALSSGPQAAAPAPERVGERADAGTVVFVTGESALLATREGRLRVERQGENVADIPWSAIQAVLLLGRHHITGPAMQAALEHQVPVHFASGSGRYRGTLWDGQPRARGHDLWLRQQARCADPEAALEAARCLMASRVRHLREVLRQHGGHAQIVEEARTELGQVLRHLPRAADASALNGLEGSATRAFFQAVKAILPGEWGFGGRNRRPPRDPFNALLSLGYTALYAQVDSILRVDGLLPWLGFYHRSRGRHAALASDLMEPFRHLVERTALNALQRRSFKPEEFTLDPALGCRLGADARRRWLGLLVRRFDTPITALEGDRPCTVHEHLHRQNLALLDWIDGHAPFRCWRMR